MTSYPQWSNRVLVLGLLLQIRFPFLRRCCLPAWGLGDQRSSTMSERKV